MHQERFHLPDLRALGRQALPNLIQGVLLPVGIFYLGMWFIGMWGAVCASLTWSWGAIGYRLVKRQRVPGLLVLGALALTARTAVAVATDSIFVYFLQPTLGTVLLAAAFLVSVPAGRPLAAKLAEDFLPMPGWFVSHPAVRRFFLRVTVLWAGIQLANAGVGFWLLVTQPVSAYLATKTLATGLVMAAGVAGSTLWFLRLLDHHGLREQRA